MNRTGEPDLFAKQWVASAMGFECSFFRFIHASGAGGGDGPTMCREREGAPCKSTWSNWKRRFVECEEIPIVDTPCDREIRDRLAKPFHQGTGRDPLVL